MTKNLLIPSALLFLLVGCATSFTGSAKVSGGLGGCETKCAAWGMDLVGMVALGEYTDGCICKKKGEKLSLHDTGESLLFSASAAFGGTSGVWMQMQEE